MYVNLNKLIEKLEEESAFKGIVDEYKSLVDKLMEDPRIEGLKETGKEDTLHLVMAIISIKMGSVSVEVFNQRRQVKKTLFT